MLLAAVPAAAAEPVLPGKDRVRVAEARRLAAALGDEIWPGWSQAPFSALLVHPDHEFLIGFESPPDGFRPAGSDEALGGPVWVREAVFQPNLRATFPVAGRPTIVIGSAEGTGLSSTEWVLVFLHEHFHQVQMGDPDYFRQVGELDLAGGDETGMWMLNYDFPYHWPLLQEPISTLAKELAGVLSKPRPAAADVEAVWRDYRALVSNLDEDDYRYLSFQLWQEGVARYVELRIAQLAADGYQPSAAFRALPDYLPYKKAAAQLRQRIFKWLRRLDLKAQRRVAFYPLGAGLAMLLDRSSDDWRERYLAEKFYLERYR